MLDINRTSNSVLFAAQNGFVVTALFVFIVTAVICVVKARRKEFDDIFMFSLSLSLTWLGSLCTKAWYAFWRYEVLKGSTEYDWMIGHWCLVGFTALLIAGGLLHIRSLTKRIYKERAWQLAALVVSMIILTSWLLFA